MSTDNLTDLVDVDTSAGSVRGRWRATTGGSGNVRSAAFLGIPFAQAPVGELRFAAPVPTEPWEGTREALEYAATAQRGDPGVTLIPEPSVAGDSTLNVNVFTPAPEPVAAGQGLPVLVWIHGGGYMAGSPASVWYDGRNFNRDDVVTVTISYRLGFDGFGHIEGAPANRGVLDWLLALEWVQQNIAAFGGDPARVTIAGQSAGGGAVLTLLGMEKAQHLFHGVYAISGALADVSLERAKEFGRKMAAGAGVAPTREGFMRVPEERLLEVQKSAISISPADMSKIIDEGLPVGPVVDGELITRPTRDSLRAGVGSDKPLVIGATDDEFSMALMEAPKIMKLVPLRFLLGKFGVPKAQRAAYLAANKDVSDKGKISLLGRVLTDRMFRTAVPNVIADRGEAPSWAYRFSWPSGTFGFAEHCLDVPFFFDCLDGPAMVPLAGENPPQALANEVHAGAVAFIASGDPGWPRFADRATARVYDVPTTDMPHAYASVEALR